MKSIFASKNTGTKTDLGLICLGSFLCLAGSGTSYVMPAYLATVAAALHLSASQIGLLSGGENFGIALTCILSSVFVKHLDRRVLAIAAVACFMGNILSAYAADFPVLLGLRFVTGVVGEGPLYAIGYAVMAKTFLPDRSFGIGMTLTVAVAAAALAGQEALVALRGSAGLLLPFAAACVVVVPALRWLPKFDEPGMKATPLGSVSNRGTFTLVGIGLWFAAPGLFWAFAESGALARHISESTLSGALAVGSILGLVGSVIPVLLSNRAGRLIPITFATAGLGLSAVIYGNVAGAGALSTTLSLFNISWNLGAVYQLAMVARADVTGRSAGLASVAQLFGLSAGPIAGGAIISTSGYGAVPLAVSAFAGAGLLLFIIVALSVQTQGRIRTVKGVASNP